MSVHRKLQKELVTPKNPLCFEVLMGIILKLVFCN